MELFYKIASKHVSLTCPAPAVPKKEHIRRRLRIVLCIAFVNPKFNNLLEYTNFITKHSNNFKSITIDADSIGKLPISNLRCCKNNFFINLTVIMMSS